MSNLTPTELAAAFRDTTDTAQRGREIERTVTLHEAEDGAQTVAVLSTRHNKDAKAMMSSVRIVRQEPRDGGPFSVTTWIPFERTHNRRLPNIPVARYSDKALESADAAALELLTNEPDWLDALDLGPYQGTL